MVIANCSNNSGPWQFPEKLILVVILKALSGEPIPLYGDGGNVRDWLYVEEHVDALLPAAFKGRTGESYCVGGSGVSSERTNQQVVQEICELMDPLRYQGAPHTRLIRFVGDRPGHDRRYAVDASKIRSEMGWRPRYNYTQGLECTVRWYLSSQFWCQQVCQRASYGGERLGGG